MRRAATLAAGCVLAACGGGDEPQPLEPGSPANPARTGSGQVTDGRIGGAFTARPGEKTVLDEGGRRLPPSLALPPSDRRGVGAEATCANAELQPEAGNLDQVGAVVLCLMNAMRSGDGLPSLAENARLEDASVKHSRDMVARKFFAHDTPDGVDLVARLRSAGYIPRDLEWVVGENLAWGSGALASPRAIVQAWMDSPGHRDNLLSPDYREVGLGIVLGAPVADVEGGAAFTTDFGTKLGGAAAPASAATRRSAAAARRRCRRQRGRARTRCLRAARRAARQR